jgi:hypothetical protein
MALYIIYSDGNTKNQEQWHIDDHKLKTPWFKAIEPRLVVEIQADGDELDAIHEICGESVPLAWKRKVDGKGAGMKRVQSWYGDHAKFIFANVVLGYEYT